MLGNAAGTLRDANVHWVPAEAPESRPNPHLKSLDPVFQPHCTLSISFNSSKTCDSSYGAGANELVFSSRSSRLIFTLHVCACEPAAIRPSLDFIYPLVLKKHVSRRNSFSSLGTANSFSTKVAICTSFAFSTSLGSSCVSNRFSTDKMLFSHSPLHADSWICSSAAPLVPILCTFVGVSPSSAPRVEIRVWGTSTRGAFVGDPSLWLC